MMICGVSYSVNYNIHDIDSYFLSSYIACIILAGIGLHNLLNMAPRLAFTALVLPVVALGINWKHCDQHDNVLVRDYVHMMIDPLPDNAVVVSQQWDFFCSAFWYMQQVEGYRRDVTLIEKELLRRTWFAHQLERWYPDAISSSKQEIDSYMIDLRDFEHDAESFMTDRQKTTRIQSKFIRMLNSFVDKNISSRPVFVTQEVFQGEEDFAKNYDKTPFGLLIRLADTNDVRIADTSRIELNDFVRASQRHHSEHLEADIAQTAARELENNARYLLSIGRPHDASWFAEAALRIDSRNTRAAEDQRMIRESIAR